MDEIGDIGEACLLHIRNLSFAEMESSDAQNCIRGHYRPGINSSFERIIIPGRRATIIAKDSQLEHMVMSVYDRPSLCLAPL